MCKLHPANLKTGRERSIELLLETTKYVIFSQHVFNPYRLTAGTETVLIILPNQYHTVTPLCINQYPTTTHELRFILVLWLIE